MSPHGDAIAVWMQRSTQDQAPWRVYASQHRAEQWSAPALLAPGAESGYPKAAIDGNGNALVAWSHVDDEGARIWASVSVPARAGQTPTLSPPVTPSSRPWWWTRAVERLRSGQRQDTNGRLRVWANRFE